MSDATGAALGNRSAGGGGPSSTWSPPPARGVDAVPLRLMAATMALTRRWSSTATPGTRSGPLKSSWMVLRTASCRDSMSCLVGTTCAGAEGGVPAGNGRQRGPGELMVVTHATYQRRCQATKRRTERRSSSSCGQVGHLQQARDRRGSAHM